MTIVPNIMDKLRTVSERFANQLEESNIRRRIETIQTSY